MQGRVTGVDITSNNRPGELGDIRIRGDVYKRQQYIIGRINIYAIGTGYIFQCTDIDSIYSEAICVKYMIQLID